MLYFMVQSDATIKCLLSGLWSSQIDCMCYKMHDFNKLHKYSCSNVFDASFYCYFKRPSPNGCLFSSRLKMTAFRGSLRILERWREVMMHL